MKNKSTSLFFLILIFLGLFLFTSCFLIRINDNSNNGSVLRIVLLVNGTLGDKSFFDSADNGMKMLKEEFGDKIEVRTIEMSYDETKWEPTLLDVSEENYDVIIVGTWQMTEMLEAAATMYPDNSYVIFDTSVNYAGGDFDNVYSIGYKQNEVSFVAGALAAKVTMSDMPFANGEKVVGFLGGMDIPVINDFLVGYIEGVQYVDKGIKVGISYIGSFSDSAKGKEMALAQYNQGADIGFNVAGQAGLGQLDAAKDVQRYAIGVDSDQAEIFAESDPAKAKLITTSALKRVDNSLYRAVKMHMDGTAPYGSAEVLGFAEECVGLADNDIFKSVVPQEIRDFVFDVEQKIMAGDIVVSSAFGMTNDELNTLRYSVEVEDTQDAAKTIKVFGAFRDQEALRFEEAMVPFEERTGIDVIYEPSAEFETQIFVQVEAGNPPDVAALPQPGLMKNFAERGKLIPLSSEVTSRIDANYTPAWKNLGSFNGEVYGVFHRVNAKSFVWYPKQVFKAEGYEIPATWDEMIDLMDEMKADGYIPWSVGIESGAATGWVATDWMEDIMLRTAGPVEYDKWVNHDIPFNDPKVKKAAEFLMDIWGDAGYTYGGPAAIATTFFGDAVKPLFEDNPKALLHRQGNFIIGFMQEEVQANVEELVGVFALPSINPEWETPVLGGGDQFVQFTENQNITDFLAYLTTWESCETWAAAGGALFPHQDQDFGDYGSIIEADLARILVNAEVFRFDASDLMPAEVGAGSFWTGMADMVTGVSIDKVLDQIEKSWP